MIHKLMRDDKTSFVYDTATSNTMVQIYTGCPRGCGDDDKGQRVKAMDPLTDSETE